VSGKCREVIRLRFPIELDVWSGLKVNKNDVSPTNSRLEHEAVIQI